jgi:hypothetical protein
MHRSPSAIIQPALLLLGGALLLLPARGLSTDTPAWIARSNENAQVLVNDLAKASPEFASRMGVPGYDDKIADLTPARKIAPASPSRPRATNWPSASWSRPTRSSARISRSSSNPPTTNSPPTR